MKPFITTYTGQKVNPLDLQISDICIEDIAHHLACINRFVGGLKIPINVAQHSVYVSRLLIGTTYELQGLLHDSPEYVLGDLSKWVKQTREMTEFRNAEDRIWKTICNVFNIEIELSPLVKQADDLMVRCEALYQSSNPEHMFALPSHPRPSIEEINRVGPLVPWSWSVAERVFLREFHLLYGDKK